MKSISFLGVLILMVCTLPLRSQTFVNFTINQPSPLSATAGNGSTICNGDMVNLSGGASGGYGGYSYLWSPAAGITNPASAVTTAIPTSNVTYMLSVTDAKNCTSSDSVSIIVLDCSGIEDAAGIEWSVYPNPAKEQLVVDIHAPKSSLIIYSVLGAVVYQKSFTSQGNFAIDLTGISKGTYHVMLESPGYKPSAKIIIIQ